jgi:hypothetical protein
MVGRMLCRRRGTAPMLATAVDPSVVCFSAERHSLLHRENFPVLREFRLARLGFAAIRCIPEAESRNIKGLVLIFFGYARARA